MLLHELRYACRSLLLRQNLAFTLATVLSFALGIGAATAIFSIAHTVLLAPLPYREAERVVRFAERNLSRGINEFSVSAPNFLSWQERARSFEALAGLDSTSANLGVGGRFERVEGMRASANVWQVLGTPLVAGRAFTKGEDTVGGPLVVILSEGVWRARFAADPNPANGESRTVVGIAPAGRGICHQYRCVAADYPGSGDLCAWRPAVGGAGAFAAGSYASAGSGRAGAGWH